MPTRVLRNDFALAVPARTVYDHVRDPASYVGLSPLVISVGEVTEADGVTSYSAVERVPVVGSWSIDNPLRVTIVAEEGDPLVVHGTVDSRGGIDVTYRYEITPTASGCSVVDLVTLRTPLGLAGFAASRARAVQLGRPAVLALRLSATP